MILKQINPESVTMGRGKLVSGRSTRVLLQMLLTATMAILGSAAFADIKVSDVQVFSGHPWKEVVIRYTITGRDANADFIRLTATDRTANKTYVVESGSSALTGAELSEGRHLLRWNAAAEGVKLAPTNVVFTVSAVWHPRVQLWANGPYWAECNVGATKPEESGYYFWWGDTIGYMRNSANNGWISSIDGTAFSFESNCPTYCKNNSQLQSLGYINETGNLTAAHDAATAHLGSAWRIPTDAEWAALISNCTTTWVRRNGVYGRLVTGKGDYASKSIFLPAVGYGSFSDLHQAGSVGMYWSSTPNPDKSLDACYLYFRSDALYRNDESWRTSAHAVRPLRALAQ